jgi:hypothetical protein
MLPPGHEAVSISFEGRDLVTLDFPFNCFPHQYDRPLSEGKSGSFVKNENVYRATHYPNTPTGRLNTALMNGHSFALATFTPAVYNPKSLEMAYYRSVTITVNTRPAAKAAEALDFISANSFALSQVSQMAQNPEMIKQYPAVKSRTDDYDYLIITDAAYENSFDDFMAFYLVRGLRSEVVTTSQIQSEMAGQDLQEKIRNYIIQEYQNHSITHVLLGGDVEYIPYRGFYCTVQSSSVYEDDDIPADIYYSALDGDWNADGDSYWGEEDEDDLLPEVSVGRLPFSSQTELDKMLNKSLNFQDSPVTGELRDPLFAGEDLYNNPQTYGSDYLELHIGFHDDNGYETQGIPEDYEFEKLYASNAYWGASAITNAINEGHALLYHVGHSNASFVMNLYISDITNSNFYGANGLDHTYTNVYTHGCICGSFDNSDCIGEEMVKIDNFAASFIGNSRYGWFNEGQTEGPSQHIHREYTDALFGSKNQRIGAAHMESKAETGPWVEAPGQWEEGAQRWCFYDCNVLGDPAMMMWTDEPQEITVNYPVAIQLGQETVEVEVYDSESVPLEGFAGVMMQNGNLIGLGHTNEEGLMVISPDVENMEIGDAQLIVSGNNVLPHYYQIDIIPNDGAYVVMETYTLHDEDENGFVEDGESVVMDVTMENVGLEDAVAVQVTLSTENEYVTLTDETENFGTIAGETSVAVAEAFAFQVAADIPDQEEVVFILTAEASDSWTSSLTVIVQAPELAIGTISIDDSQGNDNGFLDPGETATIQVANLNTGHHAIQNLVANLSTSSEFITLNSNTTAISAIQPGVPVSGLFEVFVDETAPIGAVAEFSYSVGNDFYETSGTFSLSIGLIIDNFETGDFSAMNWEHSEHPWEICETDPYEGFYCIMSADIDDNQSSEISIEAEVLSNDDISFARKVSSEYNYDYLRFYIDNIEQGAWAGLSDWQTVSFPVSEGRHVFKWSYEKDYTVSSNEDRAWIDEVIFPPMSVPTELETVSDSSHITIRLFPNPAYEKVRIFIDGDAAVRQMQVINAYGKVVRNQYVTPHSAIWLDVTNFSSGIYYVRLTGDGFDAVRKLVVR